MEKEIENILDYYGLTKKDQKIFLDIIKPIIMHDEFQRRMNPKDYPHHNKISLGKHIICDAVVSFLIAQKKCQKYNFNIEIPILIALFHDLYELPWQNAPINKESFINKHGFVHPIESAINAVTWYPEYFRNTTRSDVIIDGIIHHMYPFPVRAIDGDIKSLELNNSHKFNNLDKSIRNLIINSSLRSRIGHISLCPSCFIEGRIVSKADKIVSFGKEGTLRNITTMVTGINPDLDNYQRKRTRQ